MVRAFYTPTDKRLPAELSRIQASVRDIQRPTGTERERALLRIQDALDEVSLQQAELLARSSITTPLEGLSVVSDPPASGPGSANWASKDRAFTPLAPAGGARYVDVSVSANIAGSNTASSQPMAHLVLLYGTTPIATEQLAVPPSGAAGYPPGWGTRFRLSADLLLSTTPSALTLRIYVGAYSGGGSTTITISDVSATVRYGQRA